MPSGKLYAMVRIKWWAHILIKLYHFWIWICPWELEIKDIEAFVDWLDRHGGYSVKGVFKDGENRS